MDKKIEEMVEKINILVSKFKDLNMMIDEVVKWHSNFEDALSSIVRNGKDCFEQMVFPAGEYTALIVNTAECKIRISDNIPVPEDIKCNIKWSYKLKYLVGLEDFLDNVDKVIQKIDKKIKEVETKTTLLKLKLEKIKELLSPLVVGHKLKEGSE